MQIRICLTISFVLLLTISSAQNPITNQRLFDTIPFLPEYWPQRVSQFEKEPFATGQIIFLGNSITQMGDWKKLLGDSNVVNRGIGGDITFGILKRLDEIIKRKPSKLFLLIGINDIGKDIPDAVIADNIKKIISRLRLESPSTRIYLQSILPINSEANGFPQHYDKQSHIINTNKLLRALADSMKIDFVDLFPLFVDSGGRLDRKHTNDGLHLNPDGDGYKIWIGILRKKGFL